ncbi:MAG: FIG00985566: hypothetical protein [uncultured Thermomicrobiales bacterium]|uniref:Heparinase II/III-like C-terminal domain-containing protein n=1 Tax=uncultured Thermomicrobiales bacterium TaxID=1645740 RepID=A0A6J4UNJ2_9BACT|nr:MAG: FIG00985566: hypothetical protein [uncultured Thermomicrobiales bacterium]
MTTQATATTSILTSRFTPQLVRKALVGRESWRPYPPIDDRDGWAVIPQETRAGLVQRAEPRLGMAWPALPASVFLDFARDGNRSRYEAPHFERREALIQLVLAECIEADGRFLDDIVNGIWALCEESFWGVSAHSYSRRFERGLPDTSFPVVDLFAAETGSLLAWTHYLLRPTLSGELPVVLDRIEHEVHARIVEPYRSVDDWMWLGLSPRADDRPPNNWNPWIHSNVLAANLLLEPDAEIRAATVDRALTGIDAFLAGYHPDGGCDEGISYWGRAGGSLFDCLDLLARASDEALNAFGIPLVQEIGRYVYRAHIGGSWYVNFADGAAKTTPEPGVVYHYGKRIDDPKLMAQAAEAERLRKGLPETKLSIGRELPAIFDPIPDEVAKQLPPLIRDSWMDGIQVLTAREREGSTEGLFLAAKGGHNAESHNHNDVGHFIVGLDGAPVLIDVGVETYTRKTFSADRYDIWTMQSAYHNLPTIDGHQQQAGLDFRATDVDASVSDGRAELSLDIASAYPEGAGVRSWRRSIRLDRGANSTVSVRDTWALESAPDQLTLSLMAASDVERAEPGVLRFKGVEQALDVRFDPAMFEAEIEHIDINDARLFPVWGDHVSRVLLRVSAPAAQGDWTLTMAASAN